MGEVLPLPNRGEVFDDLRGEGRTLRVSWHSEERTLVLSMWHLGECRATFRLPSDQVPDLVRSLVVAGLTDALGSARAAGVSLLPTRGEVTHGDSVPADVPDGPAATPAPVLSLAKALPEPTTDLGTEPSGGPTAEAPPEQPGQG